MLTTVNIRHPQPLPALREGRQSIALAGVGFFGFNKQSSGHDIIDIFGNAIALITQCYFILI
ncbi:hypothetical protein [Nostoc sp. NOS(2021)]|uniref:hypothetical protein n=1 Tax=Nostoc sp. NOS(2021) TaxID=2815407 RepID=UPI0025D7D37D|nr:hypothetical protein [Nostoc sp. NOS(2021)]